jgi:hypothetical protein
MLLVEKPFYLDGYFNSFKNLQFFTGGTRAVRMYPRLKEELRSYKRKLNKVAIQRIDGFQPNMSIQQILEVLNNDRNAQVYTTVVHLPPKDFYQVSWTISKAKEVIENHNLPIIDFNVDILSREIDIDSLNHSHLNNTLNNNDPVIVVRYPVTNMNSGGLIVIDGNHRVYSRKINSIPTVKGYLLDVDHQYEALSGEFDRTIYKIHSNIHYMLDYMMDKAATSTFKYYEL